jgi:hypothetical protein
MTPKESKELQKHLKAAAAILLKNTEKEELKDFASIELAVRDHILKEVAPEIGNFFKQQQPNNSRETKENPNLSGNMASE